MSKAEKFEMEGKVLEKLPNAMFQVELDNGHHLARHGAHAHGTDTSLLIPNNTGRGRSPVPHTRFGRRYSLAAFRG